ncbi:hypothetical protein I4U23_023582 [Adineta vaga]|nr:hypothetical protein I4U23_023582 [Adineta vaga]
MFAVILTCSIIIFSLSLIIRIVIQKRRIQQHIHWSQHRHMIIQMLSISFLHMFFNTPSFVIGLIQLFLPTFAVNIQIMYLVYFLSILVSFMCLISVRQL